MFSIFFIQNHPKFINIYLSGVGRLYFILIIVPLSDDQFNYIFLKWDYCRFQSCCFLSEVQFILM